MLAGLWTCQESYRERREISTRNIGIWKSSLLVKQEKLGFRVFFPKQQIISAKVAGGQEQCEMLENFYKKVIVKILFLLVRIDTPFSQLCLPKTALYFWLLLVCEGLTYKRLVFIFVPSCWWSKQSFLLCSCSECLVFFGSCSRSWISELCVNVLIDNSVFPACCWRHCCDSVQIPLPGSVLILRTFPGSVGFKHGLGFEVQNSD